MNINKLIPLAFASSLLLSGIGNSNATPYRNVGYLNLPSGCFYTGEGGVMCENPPQEPETPTSPDNGGYTPDNGGKTPPPPNKPHKPEHKKPKLIYIPPPAPHSTLEQRTRYWANALHGRGDLASDIQYFLYVNPGMFAGSLKIYSDGLAK